MDIVISIVTFLLVISVVISIHELGHLVVAKLFGIRVLIFSLGFGKRLIGFRLGETDYRLSPILFGGYVKLSGENPGENSKNAEGEENESDESRKFINKPRWQRMLIILAGPAMNGVLTIAILSAILMTSGETRATQFVIEKVVQGSSASISGLKAGDELQAVEGRLVRNIEEHLEAVQYIRENPDTPISVEVLREGEPLNIVVIPKNLNGRGTIGVFFDLGFQKNRRGPIDSLWQSTSFSASAVKQTYQAGVEVATGKSSAKDSFVGPIGIASATGAAVKRGTVDLLLLIAVISMTVGFVNLVLPIPVMDSGKLYILSAEMIRRKDFSVETQKRLATIGLFLIFAMISAVMYIDIARIIPS